MVGRGGHRSLLSATREHSSDSNRAQPRDGDRGQIRLRAFS